MTSDRRPDRRRFLQYSATTGAFLAASSLPSFARARQQPATKPGPSVAKADKPLKILVLGGTGFLGPAIVTHAMARGHALTLFNRNRRNTHLFPDVERIKGDRDPAKDEGLKGLEGGKWDVVFDDCGYYPRHVKASAELLAPNVGHYVYVSSISCYAKTDAEGMDEDAELAKLVDPTVETMGASFENYGGLKVLCEQAAEAAAPGKTCVIRPGYIVGPTDPTDRFTYWPARFDKGGDVLVPGAPTDPLQVIDVRDLAEWMVHVAETKVVGRFNACGPEKKLEWGRVIDACVAAAASPTKARWASLDVLAKHPEAQFHIWAPYAGETKGFHTVSNARAVKAGLKFRTIETIVRDTLEWYRAEPEDRRAKLWTAAEQQLGYTPEKEKELLATLA
jgi:2'-hydroxyisoflavone reductase